MGYKVQPDTPAGVTRKSQLRLQIEALQPGDWLDTKLAPSREVTRRVCGICADAKVETGNRYTVRGDRGKGTTWVHCHQDHV